MSPNHAKPDCSDRHNESVNTNRTRLAAVIGWPVSHSLSPVIHEAGFASIGFDATYVALGVEPNDLAAAVEGLRALGFLGASVTMPHKAAVIPLLDRIEPTADRLRSVNTITWRDGSLVGDSTDGGGLLDSLTEAGVALVGTRVLVLGAGGAGRAVADALTNEARAVVGVANRTPIDQSAVPGCRIVPWSDRDAVLREVDVVVNCTSVGMGDDGESPIDTLNLRAEHVVVDLVYHPLRTPLLEGAAHRGARTIDGLGMLVHQAARQQRIWTGARPDVEAMRHAAISALDGDR